MSALNLYFRSVLIISTYVEAGAVASFGSQATLNEQSRYFKEIGTCYEDEWRQCRLLL